MFFLIKRVFFLFICFYAQTNKLHLHEKIIGFFVRCCYIFFSLNHKNKRSRALPYINNKNEVLMHTFDAAKQKTLDFEGRRKKHAGFSKNHKKPSIVNLKKQQGKIWKHNLEIQKK
eukprot:GEMP01081428.1.p1 GENE.GEMP01081428.1~~GEMP01081428.1.p1  ORF type:complete len:116 (-),score=4.48 GEMP01081428.1:546-893(-)